MRLDDKSSGLQKRIRPAQLGNGCSHFKRKLWFGAQYDYH